jgi:hypothetical protein
VLAAVDQRGPLARVRRLVAANPTLRLNLNLDEDEGEGEDDVSMMRLRGIISRGQGAQRQTAKRASTGRTRGVGEAVGLPILSRTRMRSPGPLRAPPQSPRRTSLRSRRAALCRRGSGTRSQTSRAGSRSGTCLHPHQARVQVRTRTHLHQRGRGSGQVRLGQLGVDLQRNFNQQG